MAKKKGSKKGDGGKKGQASRGVKATAKTGKAKRAKFDEVVECCCCHNKIRVKAFRNVVQKQVSAVVELQITVEPENQGELDLDLEDDGSGPEVSEK